MERGHAVRPVGRALHLARVAMVPIIQCSKTAARDESHLARQSPIRTSEV